MENTATSTKKKSSLKTKVQRLGSALSNMVMPNIGAFIAWGLITALFMATGWLPNAHLAKLITPMVTYLLPLLIAFTGGSSIAGHRGGVVGAIATMGVIVGANIPMFIGAMLMGPLGGWCIKKWDDRVQPHIRQGFEMLVNNFSSGIIGMLLAIIGCYAIGPVVTTASGWLATGVDYIISIHLIPLANIFIEPAKVLFLNNAINQGILTPLGIQQAAKAGKSILFLLEPDPGPGLGVLLAFSIFGKGTAKASAPSAIIIQFFGGIHEIYFPYILMKPALFLSVIAGGVTGTFTFSMLGAGLKASPSPGSIISILLMTPKGIGNFVAVLTGVAAATIVSFLISMVILRRDKTNPDAALEAGQAQVDAMKGNTKPQASNGKDAKAILSGGTVSKIIFACDAGMGSSAMGASILRDKVKKAGLDLSVTNTAISNLKDESGLLVVTQEELADRALKKTPDAVHVSVENFLNSPKYDEIVAGLKTKEVTADDETSTENAAQDSTTKETDASAYKVDFSKVTEVDFVHHDQNVGSATMALSTFKTALKKNDKKITARNVAVNDLEDKPEVLVLASRETAKRIKSQFADLQVIVMSNLLDPAEYDKIISELK
ncbi:PTS mannitol transporter subunit IICB [Loigolactobacillus backii]|uniref:PTS system mannitol-specific EIICB component n=1 Tax=Loigolactobacillus backii TaxID=375175 RepID=A0A192GZF7_9LACO|nr:MULTISPECIES: PTS mannitol transporter subunit IICBA [Loigolactobacillus]ANK58860.1 PTS mannitol transporter subunit IICB [Loigolactobacillus backii]ANK61475.1 PTS mannitol transporter subunit IICB [Loigolactobacillus backii]ANK63850.1 PTS mannitol transporter subunit IICB [Loigolactobacillus backii]ANK66298.1 PTS mannitol transporter subunit IICB [Loigolactobacillus backii]ANK69326.1 PTS mannitol transporter subunit IICB [Loigolactobacillus backii]